MRTTPLSKLYPYIFILVLSLSGCASIPLGTMVKFSSFDEQPKGFSFSVSANFDDFPEDRTEITFSIALQLDPTEGYFNLFEDATMEISYPDEPS